MTAATKEIAEEAKTLLRDFLQTRGLELSEEKTLITHIDDGFDMDKRSKNFNSLFSGLRCSSIPAPPFPFAFRALGF